MAKLKKFGFKLHQIIGIDDTPSKYAKNYGNLILVSEFTGEPSDDELAHLIHCLEELDALPNVRAIEKRNWRQRFRR